MANPDRIGGFSVQFPSLGCRAFHVDSSNATAFKKGDMVMFEADKRVAPATASTTDLVGSTDDRLAASTAGTVVVNYDEDQIYIAQDNGGGTVSQDNVADNCNIEANTGNTTLFISGHELDFSGIADTAALQMSIIEAVNNIEYSYDTSSEPDTDNQLWYCKCNEHYQATAVAGLS